MFFNKLNTSFQWLIILEEFYNITKKHDCHWLYELRDCCASCCSKSATRAPNSAISFVSNQPCGFVSTLCVLPNTPLLFPKSAKQLSNSATRIWNLPCVFPNPPDNFPNQVRICIPATLVSIQFKVYWRRLRLRLRILFPVYNSGTTIIW